MTVVNPDSIAGITSVTSSGTTLEFYDVNGNKLNVNADLTGSFTVGTGATINSPGANIIDFETNGQERARIASDGDLHVGGTARPTPTVSGFTIENNGKDVRWSQGGGTSGTDLAGLSIFGGGSSTNVMATASWGSNIALHNTNNTDGNSSCLSFCASTQLATSFVVGETTSHSSRNGELVFATSSGSAPTEKFRINSAGTARIKRAVSTSLGNDSIFLALGDTENGANVNRMIGFGYNSNFGTSVYPASMGYTETDNSGNTKGALTFNTRNSTGATDAPTEKLRIAPAGQVLIGETSTTGMSANDLGMKNGATIRFRKADGSAWLNCFGLDNSNNLKLGWGGAVDEIHFGISGIGEHARIDSNGEFLIGATARGREKGFHLAGANQDPAGVWTQMGIYSTDSQAANKGGSIGFGGQDGSTAKQQFAAIKGAKENGTSGNYAGYMAFYTRPAGAVSGERMRIHSDGQVTIGNDHAGAGSWDGELVVAKSTGGRITVGDTGSGEKFSIAANGDINLYSYKNDDNITFHTTTSASGTTGKLKIAAGGTVSVLAGNLNLENATATTSRHFSVTNAAGSTGWTFGNGVTASAHQFVIYDNTAGSSRQKITSNGSTYFDGSDSGTLHYRFNNGTSGASAHTQVTIKSYSNSGADPFIKFDAGGQDMIVGNYYQGTTNNELVLGAGSNATDVAGLKIKGNGDVFTGISPNDSLWDETNGEGVWYRRAQGSFAMATRSQSGYSNWYMNKNTGSGTSDRRYIDFYWNNSHVGRIQENSSGGTNYGTGSDYRLKENIVPIYDGIEKIKLLKPVRFNFKTQSADKVNQGFIAHEAQPIVPHAVTGEKDAVKVNEKGVETPDYQDMDYGQLTPILTAALKDLITKVETLEAEAANDREYEAKIDKLIDYFKL